MSSIRNEVLIRRRIRRGEPVLHLLFQLVAYKILSVTAANCGGNQRTLRLVYFVQGFVECDYDLMSAQVLPVSARYIPKSCRILSVDALPSNEAYAQKNIHEQSCNNYPPSITDLALPTSPWTTPNVCTTVIRASSCVNRSNLRSTASTSPSPNIFFVNFSVTH